MIHMILKCAFMNGPPKLVARPPLLNSVYTYETDVQL
jgi:hypothetical protein